MPFNLTAYKVFIASPSGLEEERKAFAEVIDEYNKSEAIHKNVMFIPVGWEDTLPGIGRPQSLINEDLEQCDYFLLLLHDKWGSNPRDDEKGSTSGTEEEYGIAMDCFADSSQAMKQVVCSFKSVPINQMADPGKQLKKVLDFRKKLEKEKKLLYSSFSSLDEFKSNLRRNLGRWLRDDSGHAGYLKPSDEPNSPLDEDPQLDLGESSGSKDIDESIKLAQDFANKGRIVAAEIEFSKALIKNPSENLLIHYADFLSGIGQLSKANLFIDQALEMSKNSGNQQSESLAYKRKGRFLRNEGNLKEAKDMYLKSLLIDENLKDQVGVAANYGSLGNLLRLQGDLDEAERMFKRSLKINEQLNSEKGIAANYDSLGHILLAKGYLKEAEELYLIALVIEKKLKHIYNVGVAYASLGHVYSSGEYLDKAEEFHRKSLDTFKQMDNKIGIATQLGNVGMVLGKKHKLEESEKLIKQSLDLNIKIGNKEGVATQYGNLGIIFKEKEDLQTAKEMWEKSLLLFEQLDSKDGIASIYGNLGNVLKIQGDLKGAKEMFLACLEIAEKSGFSYLIESAKVNLKEFEK